MHRSLPRARHIPALLQGSAEGRISGYRAIEEGCAHATEEGAGTWALPSQAPHRGTAFSSALNLFPCLQLTPKRGEKEKPRGELLGLIPWLVPADPQPKLPRRRTGCSRTSPAHTYMQGCLWEASLSTAVKQLLELGVKKSVICLEGAQEGAKWHLWRGQQTGDWGDGRGRGDE